MKKSLLLAGALLGLSATACGPQDDVTELGEAPAGLDATAFATSVSAAALTATGCTQLTAASVIAKGHDGNVPANTMDDKLGTRWSYLGKGGWIDYDLGASKSISGVTIAWHEGTTRANTFTVSVSPDGYTYTQVFSGTSSKSSSAETYSFSKVTARRVRITFMGNTMNDWASIAEARACSATTTTPPPTTPPPTGSSVVWVGDFETNNISQWTRAQMVSADRLAMVSSPKRQGGYALKATVKRGDDPINSSGNRNELVRMTREPSGSEYYYRWSTMFDSTFPNVNTWQLFTQWHQESDTVGGSPPVEFYVYGNEVRLNIGGNPGTIVWRAPLTRGKWMDFIFHVRWSADSKVGFVELYLDGKLVMPKRYIATQYSGQVNYLKIGLYRNDTITQTGIVYHDGWLMARKLEDVLNPTAVIKAP
ncbi:heparin lyase I family protein [Myxococcus sp. CA051A]|uniref:heparin lyase I family protein n=1 Tax=unclassified Myxococcus TaxID=2648731 RepID=UPI00157B294A|nr:MULTISPECIES: heparin lyase I family protein [unclassified Myxococcus]NTX35535.1 heparin lyase I family protein [Myxococcus sp. CA033]NTX62060.1 heparin lyase I family protein [Myxococcus sp. CA051A]